MNKTTRNRDAHFVFAILIAGLFAVVGSGDVRAQSGMHSVRAVGVGGGSSIQDTGPATLYSNPANLTVGPREHPFEVQLFRIGSYVGGNFYQFEHITPLFYDNEPRRSREEQRAILDEWFGNEQRSANTYQEIIPVSITYRPSEKPWAVGFGIRARAFQTFAVDKGLYSVLLEDGPVPVEGRTRLYGTIDVTGAFSYRFSSLPLSVGVSPRIIFGTTYADVELIDTRASVNGNPEEPLVLDLNYEARAAGRLSAGVYDQFDAFSASPLGDDAVNEAVGGASGISGGGSGLDLGATYTVRSDLHVSASITDLGFILWGADAQTVTPVNDTFRYEGVTLNMDQLENEFDGDVGEYFEHQVDSLFQDAYRPVERDRSAFTTGLPTALHVNGTWTPVSLVTVNGGLSVGLNEEAGAVPDPVAMHLGGTLNIDPVPIQAGVRFMGAQALTLSGGFAVDVGVYRFDLGVSATPSTSALGSGARYAVSLSLATIRP